MITTMIKNIDHYLGQSLFTNFHHWGGGGKNNIGGGGKMKFDSSNSNSSLSLSISTNSSSSQSQSRSSSASRIGGQDDRENHHRSASRNSSISATSESSSSESSSSSSVVGQQQQQTQSISSDQESSKSSITTNSIIDPRSLIGIDFVMAGGGRGGENRKMAAAGNHRYQQIDQQQGENSPIDTTNDMTMTMMIDSQQQRQQRKRHRTSLTTTTTNQQPFYGHPFYYGNNNWMGCCDNGNNQDYGYFYGAALCQQQQQQQGNQQQLGRRASAPPALVPFNQHHPQNSNYYYIMDPSSMPYDAAMTNSADAFPPPPPPRRWIQQESQEDEDEQSDRRKLGSVTTMSYNILCDKYISSSLHSLYPWWALNWEYRKRLIFRQLQKHQPDIIALQELETMQYWTYFKPKLAKLGYAGTFLARSKSKTMNHAEKQSVDGCALFWKVDKFELHSEHDIEFTQLAMAKAERSQHMLNRVMTRDNIALTVVLRFRRRPRGARYDPSDQAAAGIPLVVCCTHIHWDPEFCDVKLIQSMMLTQEIASIVQSTARRFNIDSDDVPLLLCGDLNSTEDSSVYEFLTTGGIEADHEDFKDFRGQACLQKLSSADYPDVYCHDLQLKSAYEPGTLPFTNYGYEFKGVIDYIFSSPSLVCESVLGPMSTTWFRNYDMAACPCPYVPSDHIPLLATHSLVLPLQQLDQDR